MKIFAGAPGPDGCSGGISKAWKLATGTAPLFEWCCDEHDLAYDEGGTAADRRRADLRLRECAAGHGCPRLAWLMWVAVRLCGWMFWERTEIGAVKHDQGKLRLDLITPEMHRALGDVLTYGAQKYSDRNWEKGIDPERLYAACQRHLLAHREGETVDAESGLPHLAHAFCTLGMMVTLARRSI
jgi:hypothetical protein